MSEATTLYARLGGYDAIAAVANNLVSRLMSDARLGRFWANRGEDGVRREIQLLIDFLCHSAGGPMLYTGRDMKISHKGKLSTIYSDLLEGSYDCVDRVILNAYFGRGQFGGGFRLWWRALNGSDENLDDNHLMRMAGRFSRRLRAWAKENKIGG